ncbi:GNAT family N-acetyltransferase [Candidatus Bathyarchaeota archaeon]|nr:MAG: GNAT family N-acetyltransferase [Candidatus Bathyarchaeota archaeon]
MRRREFFKVTKITRKFDRRTGKFTINIRYKTRTEVTPRTVAVSEAFGLGVDEFQEHVVYDNVELKIGPKDIVYITGDSGSGKSVLLRALEKDLAGETVNIADVKVVSSLPLIDTIGQTIEKGLELLSRVGLNDAFLFVRRYDQLSDGQKYRYRIAKMIEAGKQYWILDEFCSLLDRDTAKIVAHNIRKLARQEGKAVLAATTHTDLYEDLRPMVHIHKRFGKEITVKYHTDRYTSQCTLVKEMQIQEGTREDYEELAVFHYRDSRRLVCPQKIFVLKREGELCGVIVYKSPAVRTAGRKKAFGRVLTIYEVNQVLTCIARVVVHPKYRTIGLGVKLVRETLPLADKPYVETTAVMARYNPFFERAGMTKIAESTPRPAILEGVEKLRRLGFNQVLLGSTKYTIQRMRKNPCLIKKVRTVFKHVSKAGGVYRKRIASTGRAYMKHNEFCECVDRADIEKLARMIKILSFLIQTKVYLFWKR